MAIENINEKVIIEGFNAVRAVICGVESGTVSRSVYGVFFAEGRLKKKGYEYAWLAHKSASMGFPLTVCEDGKVSALCESGTAGGIVALCTARAPIGMDRLDAMLEGEPKWFLAAEGIEDPYNLGYMIRSAYAFGASGVLLPERAIFGADNVLCRSSAGASERLPLLSVDLPSAAKRLKAHGYAVCAASEKEATAIGEASLSLPLCMAIGGEKRGLSSAFLAECDRRIVIPYSRNLSSSLSAVSATDILCYEIANKNQTTIKREKYENF